MVAPLPRLNDSPILRTGRVVSERAGHEAEAKLAGGIGEFLASKAQSLSDEASSSMYIEARKMADGVITNYRKSIIENPGNAEAHLQTAKEELENIRSNAVINKKHRSQLDNDFATLTNHIDVETARTQQHISNRVASLSFFSRIDQSYKDYRHALERGDEKGADQIKENLANTARQLFQSGAITAHQAASVIKHLIPQVDAADDYHEQFRGGVSAQEHNALQNMGQTLSPAEKIGMPINEGTRQLHEHHSNDLTTSGVYSDLYNGRTPNFGAYTKLNENGRAKAHEIIKGTGRAQGMIDAHVGQPAIETRIDDLNAKKGHLTVNENAELYTLEQYTKNLDNNFQETVKNTPMGQEAHQDFQSQNDAINEAPVGDGDKEKLHYENYNKWVNNMIAIGRSNHIPLDATQPIAKQYLKMAQDGLKLGGDPQDTLTALSMHDKSVRGFVAFGLKEPLAQQVTLSAGYLRESDTPEFQNKYVLYNQKGKEKGQDYSLLKLGANEGESATKMEMDLAPAVKDILNYKRRLPGGFNQSRAFMQSAINYLKGEALANNDFAMDHRKDYIDEFTYNMGFGYDFVKGKNYQFNRSDLPTGVTDRDADLIASYAHDRAIEEMHKKHIEVDETRNPLYVTVTPQREIVVLDVNNNSYYNQPITSDMLSVAKTHTRKKEKSGNSEKSFMSKVYTAFTGEE